MCDWVICWPVPREQVRPKGTFILFYFIYIVVFAFARASACYGTVFTALCLGRGGRGAL